MATVADLERDYLRALLTEVAGLVDIDIAKASINDLRYWYFRLGVEGNLPGGGGGGGAVNSVNGKTGTVVIDKTDIGLGNVTNDAQLKAADLDIDGTFVANSDAKVPSQKAVKTYVDANSGGGAGAVSSVNGKTGTVTLTATDVGAVPDSRLVNGHALSTDVTVTKGDVGLGNVTNDAQLKSADLDTDGTLTANLDTKIPSQKAVKTYADKAVEYRDYVFVHDPVNGWESIPLEILNSVPPTRISLVSTSSPGATAHPQGTAGMQWIKVP